MWTNLLFSFLILFSFSTQAQFGDLTPSTKTITGATDSTEIGNVGDALKVAGDPGVAIAPKPFLLAVGEGNVPGYSSVYKFGSNPDIDAGTAPEDVWSGGGAYPWPTSAQTTTIVSTNSNDTSAGTGCRTAEVEGLNSSWALTTQTAIAMNGTTAVTLGTDLIRVFRAKCLTVGSNGVNIGDLQVKHSSTVLAQIDAGMGQTVMAIYTVPANKTAYLKEWTASIARSVNGTGNKTAHITLFVRPFGGSWQAKDTRIILSEGADGKAEQNYTKMVTEKSDMRVEITDVNTNNTSAVASFFIVLKDN